MDELINNINNERIKILLNINMKDYTLDEIEVIEYMKLYYEDNDEDKQQYIINLGYI